MIWGLPLYIPHHPTSPAAACSVSVPRPLMLMWPRYYNTMMIVDSDNVGQNSPSLNKWPLSRSNTCSTRGRHYSGQIVANPPVHGVSYRYPQQYAKLIRLISTCSICLQGVDHWVGSLLGTSTSVASRHLEFGPLPNPHYHFMPV